MKNRPAAARHAAIAAASAEPCPFCGCNSAMSAHPPVRRAAARRRHVQEDRSAFPPLFSDHPRSAFQPGTADELAAAASALAVTVASWESHRIAGEVPIITDGASHVEWRRAA